MRKESLEEFNEWWSTGEVPGELRAEYKRDLFFELVENIEKRYIMSIVGLRRTGKTTIIYQLMDYLLQKDADPKNIVYFSFDEKVEGLNDVMDAYRDIQNRDIRKNRTYMFLDEVQKLGDWQNQVKKYYDLYPKLKLVISGSESLSVGKLSRETLAGRIHEFHLPTLSFREFLGFKGIKSQPFSPTMKPEFAEYVTKGGFPEMVNETNMKEVGRYIRSSVIDKIVRGDIPQMSGIKDVELLHKLLESMAINPGMYLNYQSLAQKLDMDRRTLKEYVMWLEDSFLIRLMGNYRKGAATLRKSKRAYLSDTGIISAFKHVMDEAFFGRMVESAVINVLGADSFWKNRGEVDAVVGGIPVEVKYQEQITKSDLRAVTEFMRKFRVSKGFVVTKDREETMSVNGGRLSMIPAWKLLLDPAIIRGVE